jgi:hypothetical protein
MTWPALLLVALVTISGCASNGDSSGDDFWRGKAAAAPEPSYFVPDQTAVADRDDYKIRPCPTEQPSADGSLFATHSIQGLPGANAFTSTSLVDAGPIDLRDGELWQGGAENLPFPDTTETTDVPAGQPHVVLLLANNKYGGTPAAVEVRIGSGRAAVWRQVDSLGGGTDAGTMAVAGAANVEQLRSGRSPSDALDDIDATAGWLTPCQRYSLSTDDSSSPSRAIEINLGGDGGWPGAIGFDKAGEPVDVVLSTGLLPWSLLGLSGSPPPEALVDEPPS